MKTIAEDPKHPGKHLDPATGIWPLAEWGNSCYQGFIANSRFGSGQVIKRNPQTFRRWLRGSAPRETKSQAPQQDAPIGNCGKDQA